MKTDPTRLQPPDIDALLRFQQPEPATPPHLEAAIHRALREKTIRPARRRVGWRWLVFPSAIAAVFLGLAAISHTPPARPDAASAPADSGVPNLAATPPGGEPAPVIPFLETPNPLENETLALGRDAQRVSAWFLKSLPSVSPASTGE
jgi:hypothetical protein